MKIAPTGLIFYGLCEIRSKVCVANNGVAPITSVWSPPGNTQINVCHACLNYNIKKGRWNIDGAITFDMKQVVDIAIIDFNGNVNIIIEVKNMSSDKSGLIETVRRNEYTSNFKYIIIAAPLTFYIYNENGVELNKITTKPFFQKYLETKNFNYENITVKDIHEIHYSYRNVVQKHFDFVNLLTEFFKEMSTGAIKIPQELQFLKNLIIKSSVKKEYVINNV